MEAVRTLGMGEGWSVGQLHVTAAEQILRPGTCDLVAERWARRGSAGVVPEMVVERPAVGTTGEIVVYVQGDRQGMWGSFDASG